MFKGKWTVHFSDGNTGDTEVDASGKFDVYGTNY